MPAGQENLDVIRTTFEDAVQGVFGDRPPGVWDQFTQLVDAPDANRAEVGAVDGAPAPVEWLGDKEIGGMRALSVASELRKWHRTMREDLDKVRTNPDLVAQRIRQFLAEQSQLWDYVVLNAPTSGDGNSAGLLNNPTGFDGVSLLNNSHPHVGSSGTSDNLTTNALSRSELSTARQALNEMKDEAGEPISGGASHLLVGPAQVELAQELTGSEKPVAIDESGDINQGSSGVGAVNIRNFVGGAISVIESPRITGNEWFLMNLVGPRRPMFLYQFMAPRENVLDQPNDNPVFYRNEAHYSIEGKATPMAGDWRTIYGSVTN